MKKLYFVFLCVSVVACSHTPSQINQLVGPNPTKSLVSLPKDQIGYYLFDPVTHEILEASQEARLFIPASTTKIPTTIAALEILGPGYRFPTTLSFTGKIRNHVLEGDLYLKGYGDPLLKIAHLMELAKALHAKGVRKVAGHFYYDDSYFPSVESIEPDREPWASFNCGVSPLSVEFNLSKVQWRPTAEKGSYEIWSIPPYPFLQFDLASEKVPDETDFLFKKTKEKDVWALSPDRTAGGKKDLPVKQPALATASLLAQIFEVLGIETVQPEAGSIPKNAVLVAKHESIPLVQITDGILEYSNNLMAELIQMAAARKLNPQLSSMKQAALTIRQWYEKKLPELKNSPYSLENGSGLNAKNQLSPKNLVQFLSLARPGYDTLLPISGWKGFLDRRLFSADQAFHVWAKTGSMYYTNAIAGFLHTKSKRRLIFAIMTTDFQSRSWVNHTQGPFSETQLQDMSRWTKKATSTQDAILQRWMGSY